MKILLLTRSLDNDCTNRVMTALQARGHQPFRFDTDLYPQSAQLSTSYYQSRQRRQLTWPGGGLDLAEVEAVYFRRFDAGARLPHDLGEFRQACYLESQKTIYGTIAALDCFQLDPFQSIRHAEFKELQYKFAIELGLQCPRTLFSNEPQAVAQFASEVGQVVAKLQAKVVVHRHGQQQAVFTSLLGQDELNDMAGLRFSPMMFQEKIAKARELRVMVVGEQILAAAIDTSRSEVGHIDMRLDEDLCTGWERWELPENVAEALRRLVHRFGLNYSAADLILTPDGRYLFLEINPAGEWMWLDRDLGLPVAEAIADTLSDPARRLKIKP